MKKEIVGHDCNGLERYDAETKHMIVCDILTNYAPIGWVGERYRLFLSDFGYERALASQARREMRIVQHARVIRGHLLIESGEGRE